ncbi:unnamed protein product [marine sediment metagenome]|uniref:GIY-YIG domain-containing protein n=1 Tax=marine sediment metagenome TaxID=412755 RepID=X0TQ01_9ZZZZ
MKFWTYAIKSKSTGKIYIGHTSNFKLRLKRHNKILPIKKKSYTYKNKGPWKLVYKEKFKTRKEAIKREKELKSFKGREFIRKLITGR